MDITTLAAWGEFLGGIALASAARLRESHRKK